MSDNDWDEVRRDEAEEAGRAEEMETDLERERLACADRDEDEERENIVLAAVIDWQTAMRIGRAA